MNAPNELYLRGERRHEIEPILQGWGIEFEDASKWMLDHAHLIHQCQGMRAGEIAVHLGLCTSEWVESILKQPSTEKTLKRLADYNDQIRTNQNQILSIQKGLLFVPAINVNMLHPTMADHEVGHWCETGSSIVLTLPGTPRPIVAFADIDALNAFGRMGRSQESRHPLLKNWQNRPIVSLTKPSLINMMIMQRSGSAVLSSDGDAVFSASTATTQEERLLSRLIELGLEHRATDIDLSSDIQTGVGTVYYRIYNDLMQVNQGDIKPAEMASLDRLMQSISKANPDNSRLRLMTSGRFTFRTQDGRDCFIRASFIPLESPSMDRNPVSTSLRLLPRTQTGVVTLEMQKIHPEIAAPLREAASMQQGLIVLCGPTNTGKSSTIAAMLGEHYSIYGDSRKRLAMEDPVEAYRMGVRHFQMPDTSKVDNPESLFKEIVRHDPDVVLIGEVRDYVTAYLSVRAASSGHLTYTTTHSKDSLDGIYAISRMLTDVLYYDLVDSLTMVISQRLVKKLCPACKTDPIPLSEEEKARLAQLLRLSGVENVRLPEATSHATGCSKCREGFVGVMPVNELLQLTPEVKDILLRDRTSKFRGELIKFRGKSMQERALELAAQGLTTLEEVIL